MKLAEYVVKFHHEDHSKEKEHYVTDGTKLIHPVTGEEVEVSFLVTPPPSFSECRIYRPVLEAEDILATSTKMIESNHKTYIQIGVGVATLHEGDLFKKEIGRRISLTRAMESAELSREVRAQIWEAYRTSSPNPKWKKKEDPIQFFNINNTPAY